jgi:uncharacterized membrane protein
MCPVYVSVSEFVALISMNLWAEIAAHTRRLTLIWVSCFIDDADLALKPVDLDGIFV